MRTSRPVAEKLGAVRQDPDLDGLLFGLISRATGGCHEHAARLDHIHVVGAGLTLRACSLKRRIYLYIYTQAAIPRAARLAQAASSLPALLDFSPATRTT